MKTISKLRKTLNFHPQEINSSVKHFFENVIIDYKVWLPTKKMNLQRDFVWNIDQKRELIWSILMNRHIPRMSIMTMVKNDHDIYQVIDGKQRLSAMIGFYKNEYTLLIDEKEYFFNELPIDYQRVIQGYHFAYYMAYEPFDAPFTDQDKIDWFTYINFAGTPQEREHFGRLTSK